MSAAETAIIQGFGLGYTLGIAFVVILLILARPRKD